MTRNQATFTAFMALVNAFFAGWTVEDNGYGWVVSAVIAAVLAYQLVTYPRTRQ